MTRRTRLGRSEVSRRYGPIGGLLGAMLLVVLALPSSLNVPQSNPTTTPEFAPVPPQDQKQPPPLAGNLAGVGFASSNGIGGGPAAPRTQALPPGGAPAAIGKTPSTKECVGNPPRQTEDPLSPPCVAYYAGDNGGATHAGVTSSEIRIVIINGGSGVDNPSSRGRETSPTNACFDLGQPDTGNDTLFVRTQRRLQQYFNLRYQTYQRVVRFITCWGPQVATPETRRADATQHYAKYKPFAFVSLIAGNGNPYPQDYADVMLRHGVMQFSARPFVSAADFTRNKGLVWDYAASVEEQAAKYAGFVCTKVVHHAVSFSGNNDLGRPRVLGLLHAQDPQHPELSAFATAVKQRINACGGSFKVEATYKYPYTLGATDTENPSYGTTNMAEMQRQGVTTIVWPGGWEDQNAKAAASLGYYPEWVMASDGEIDAYGVAQFQEQTEWQHAWLVSEVPRAGRYAQSDKCFLAIRQVDPSYPEQDAKLTCTNGAPYEALRQLVTGVQLAGPQLTPAKIEEGFRAIPPRPSADPATPSCYYEPDDYTCVKDSIAEWWDPTAVANNNRPGCWKMVQEGRRRTAATWPSGDVTAQKDPARDVCNGWDPTIFG